MITSKNHVILVFLEGTDDKLFFEHIIKSLLKKTFKHVKIIPFANEKSEKIRKIIYTAKKQHFSLLIVVDHNDAPCITYVKEKFFKRFNVHEILRNTKIIIVVKKSIESWYLAGADSKKMKIPRRSKQQMAKLLKKCMYDTQNIGKQEFNAIIPKGFPRALFLSEILKSFNLEKAKKRNESFAYFFLQIKQLINAVKE